MHIVPAFLIAPLPSTLLAGIALSLEVGPTYGLFLGLLLLMWLLQIFLGSFIVWLMRRWCKTALWHYAFGGAAMIVIGLLPLLARRSYSLQGPVQIFAEILVALLAGLLIGTPTGLLFGWLTRDTSDRGPDLADLRQRFE